MLLGLGLGVSLLVYIALDVRLFIHWAQPLAQKFVPGLSVGRIRIEFDRFATARVVANDVEVRDYDGNPAVDVAALEASVDLAQLMQNVVSVESLAVSGVRLHEVRRGDGLLSLQALVRPREETTKDPDPSPAALPAFVLKNVELTDVQWWHPNRALTRLGWLSANGFWQGPDVEVNIDHLALTHTAAALSIEANLSGSAALSLHGLLATLRLSVNGAAPSGLSVEAGIVGPLYALAARLSVTQRSGTDSPKRVASGNVLLAPEQSLVIGTLDVASLSLGDWLARLSGTVSGSVEFLLHGDPLSGGEAQARVAIKHSSIAGQAIDFVKLRAHAQNHSVVLEELEVVQGAASLHGGGKVVLRSSGEGSVSVHAKLDLPPGYELLSTPLHGKLTLTADFDTDDWARANIVLRLREASLAVPPARIDLGVLDATLTNGVARLHAQASVSVPERSMLLPLVADAEIGNAADLLAKKSRAPHATASVQVSHGRVSEEGDLHAVVTAELGEQTVQLGAEAGQGGDGLVSVSARCPQALLTLLQAPYEQWPVELSARLYPIDFSRLFRLLGDTAPPMLSGELAATINARGAARAPVADVNVVISSLRHPALAVDSVRLEAKLSTERQTTRLASTLMINQEPWLTLNGGLGAAGEELASEAVGSAILRADAVLLPKSLRQVLALLPESKRQDVPANASVLEERVSLRADVRGPLLRPKITAQAELGPLRLLANLRPPYTEHLDIDLHANAFPLTVVQPFVPVLRVLRGTLDGALRHRGRLALDNVSGEIAWREGALAMRGLPSLSKIDLAIDVGAGHAVLHELQVELERGGSIGGTLDVAPVTEGMAWRGQLVANEVAVDYRGLDQIRVSGVVDGQATLSRATPSQATLAQAKAGDDEAPKLVGTVSLKKGKVSLPELAKLSADNLSASTLPDDIVMVESLLEVAPTIDSRGPPLPLHLNLKADVQELSVRSPDLLLEPRADLTLRTDTDRRLLMFGKVYIDRGYLMVLSRRWDVERALVGLSGARDLDPSLDLQLQHDFSSVLVTMGVAGTVSRPELVLKSDPAGYEKAQLLSLVATGRIEPGTAQGQGATDALAAVVMQSILRATFGKVTETVGIDVLRVGLDSQSSGLGQKASGARATLEVGKWITERLYVGYERGFGSSDGTKNANTLKLELQLAPRFMLEGAFGDAGVGGLDLLWLRRF